VVNRNLIAVERAFRTQQSYLRSAQISHAACKFPVRGLKKNVLTVTGSGCVALGHPARPRYWLPEKRREPGRTPLSKPLRRRNAQTKANEQATPIPLRKKTAGASRATRVPAAATAAGSVSRRCRERPRNCDGATRRRLIAVWSSCSRRKSSEWKSRLDRIGAAALRRSPVQRSMPVVALVVSDPSLSPTIGQAPVPRRRCGA
jgi:hypothetical protein